MTPKNPQSGAALLTVLVAMMIMSLMLFEFQYGAMVERKLAYNDLNQLQASYLAKSGARFGLLRAVIYGKAKTNPMLRGNPMITSMLDQIWSIPFPPFPPVTADLSKMEKAEKDAAETVLKQTKITDGKFTHTVSSESSKINLNLLMVNPAQLSQRVEFNCRNLQKGMFYFTGCALMQLVDTYLKESEDPYEEYGLNRSDELVYNLMDWINPGGNSFAGGNKDAFYERLSPPYKAKRDRFYTLDELRLVKGINEKLLSKIRPNLTVFSDQGKININNASTRMHMALYPEFTEEDIKKIQDERQKWQQQNQIGWPDVATFVDFVTKNLGRTGFATLYPDPQNYPFTTDSQSFLVESRGELVRSGSTIEKMIRVVVAFSAKKGGDLDTSIVDRAKCDTPGNGRFWHADNSCHIKPTNNAECINIIGTPASAPAGQFCCNVNRPEGGARTVCVTDAEKLQNQQASSMKILSWTES